MRVNPSENSIILKQTGERKRARQEAHFPLKMESSGGVKKKTLNVFEETQINSERSGQGATKSAHLHMTGAAKLCIMERRRGNDAKDKSPHRSLKPPKSSHLPSCRIVLV